MVLHPWNSYCDYGINLMKIAYKNWKPRAESLMIVDQAEKIIEEFQDDGYTLTLRQLYYQFVSKALIENTERSYKNLGNIITSAREAGLISWTAIEDRTRHYNGEYTNEDPLVPIKTLPWGMIYDQWKRQDTYIEVWVEKEALGNVIERACDPLMVGHMACKGYLSASAAWRAGLRFAAARDDGKDCVLIHLGDHDPSGIDMTRDNNDRLGLYSGSFGTVDVVRVALNMDQIDEYQPPPNPAKLSDSRARDYISQYGSQSWELDALEPSVIVELIKDTVEPYINRSTWDDVQEMEDEARAELRKVGNHWDEIAELLAQYED